MTDQYKSSLTNILITGASGYVGRALITKFNNKSLYTLDRTYDEYISKSSVKFICNDLNKLTADESCFLNDYMGTVFIWLQHVVMIITKKSIFTTILKLLKFS